MSRASMVDLPPEEEQAVSVESEDQEIQQISSDGSGLPEPGEHVEQPQEPQVPEKYQGKSLEEVVQMHQEAEKLLGRQSSEVGELRKVVDDFITNQTPQPAPQQEKPEDDLDYFVENFTASGFRGPLNRYRNSEKDFYDLPLMGVARIKQPSCFIAGSKDVVRSFVPGKDVYEGVDELCDDMRIFKIVEGSGHWVQQENPKEVNSALIEFLNTMK